MSLRVKTLIEFTKEYVLPILNFANVRLDEYGFMKPIGVPDSQAYKDSSETGNNRFFVVVTNESQYEYHLKNKDTTVLFNPFLRSDRGSNDIYRLVKFIERIVYSQEFDDFYTDETETETIDKDEATIRDEMSKYINITMTKEEGNNGLNTFAVNVYREDIQEHEPLVAITAVANTSVGLLLLCSEVIKYYTQNTYDDQVKYGGNINKKAFILHEAMEKITDDINRNNDDYKKMHREIKEKTTITNDKDLILDTDQLFIGGNNMYAEDYDKKPAAQGSLMIDDNSILLE